MSDLGLRAYDQESRALRLFPLSTEAPAEGRLRMRGLPGASAVQLDLVNGDRVRHRFEVEADGEEAIAVHWERTEDDRFEVWSQGRRVLSLPPDERYAPPPPVGGSVPGAESLDLAILVDATAQVMVLPPKGSKTGGAKNRRSEQPPPEIRPLLEEQAIWRRHGDLLVEIVEGLRETHDSRVGVFAFGDHPVAGLRAPGLRPDFRLHPRDGSGWKLEDLTSDEIRERLRAIPPTSGGDFVDALADGLQACVGIPWREGVRRLVLVTGNSPGYSILHPAPAGASLIARRLEVDTQAMALHRIGVELVTLYHPVPEERALGSLDYERALKKHAAAQYRRLASRPTMAFDASKTAAADVVRSLSDAPWALARGAAYGVLLEPIGDAR